MKRKGSLAIPFIIPTTLVTLMTQNHAKPNMEQRHHRRIFRVYAIESVNQNVKKTNIIIRRPAGAPQ